MNRTDEEVIAEFIDLMALIKAEGAHSFPFPVVRLIDITPEIIYVFKELKRTKYKMRRAFDYHLRHCKDKLAGIRVPDLEHCKGK